MRKVLKQNLAYDDQKDLYYVTLHAGMLPDGTRKRKIRTFRRIEDAEQALLAFHHSQYFQRIAFHADMLLSDWLEYWLCEYIRPCREKTTIHGYENIIYLHIVPAIGSIRLDELSPTQLQHYYTTLLSSGLSPNTVRKHHCLLHTALDAAVHQRILPDNITRFVTPPAKTSPKHSFYNSEQLAKIFQLCEGEQIEPAIKLAGYLGLRRSEICGLKWRNIDLKNHIINICEVRTAAGGISVEKKPKSYASGRRLGYNGVQDLENMLASLHAEWIKKRTASYNPEGYVLTTVTGGPYHPDQLCCEMSRFISHYDLPPISLHGLRHSFASIANSRSVPMFTISKALGHSSTSITSAVYTHLFDETVQDVVNTVAEAIVHNVQSSVST